MKKTIIYIFCISFIISCYNKKEKEASNISNKKDSTYLLLTSSSNLEECIDYIESDIKFTKCFDKEFSTTFRSTKDSNFKTPEGVFIGMHLNSVKNISKAKLVEDHGWAYYFPLKSGWNAAFILDIETDYQTIKDSTVAFIFKTENQKKELPKIDTVLKEKIIKAIE